MSNINSVVAHANTCSHRYPNYRPRATRTLKQRRPPQTLKSAKLVTLLRKKLQGRAMSLHFSQNSQEFNISPKRSQPHGWQSNQTCHLVRLTQLISQLDIAKHSRDQRIFGERVAQGSLSASIHCRALAWPLYRSTCAPSLPSPSPASTRRSQPCLTFSNIPERFQLHNQHAAGSSQCWI